MTPQEKWERINNPKVPEDYNLHLTDKELCTFHEGRELLKHARKYDHKEKEEK